MTLFAVLGAKSLFLLYAWLASAIAASYLSERKGYGSKVGLAFGLLLSAVGALIWLLVPARADSRWKLQGVFGSGGKTVAEARAERDASSHGDGS
jgi:fucose permease